MLYLITPLGVYQNCRLDPFGLCGNKGSDVKITYYNLYYHVTDSYDPGWIAVLYDGVRFSDESG